MLFESLRLSEPIQQALKSAGYKKPTPIQAQAIPLALEGRDLLACAQTGTGKTAGFALPILQQILQQPRSKGQGRVIQSLILAPTRELAIQIGESLAVYGQHTPIRHTVIFGGVSQHQQTNRLKAGVDILVATPGRLLDLINQGFIKLNKVKYFVLDEADRMLDMGFIHDVRRIIQRLPEQRQTLFFSATMPPKIVELSDAILDNPATVQVDPVSSTAERVEQAVYFVAKKQKRDLLIHLLKEGNISEALVFTRTKHGANRVVKVLCKAGFQAEAIHGNKSQNARQKALKNFKQGHTKVLVATDIAARGIDIDDLSHVINFDLPNISETYVHRIGRTGRAGASGTAWSFCDAEERAYLRDIQKLISNRIPIIKDHPFPETEEDQAVPSPSEKARPSNRPSKKRPPRNAQRQRRRNKSRKSPQKTS
jgi:ATP-dependent RNA helicase RhlE